MSVIAGANIVLGVTGGIAAYKAADLASRLVQAGATVDVILTAGGAEFVRPLTFSALTRRPVRTDLFAPWLAAEAGHVSLAAAADALVVAPATADVIARLALGLADDYLGAVALAVTAPLVVAPAMEHHMLHHPAVADHLATLERRGATIVPPGHGRLASGAIGDGRLAPIESIVGAIRAALGRNGPLAGRTVVVTAGGTHEPIDPVRFIGNRSSGQMGYAIAEEARDRGASVVLVAGP
ncbi:MAG TPA: bifunctional phosphopantothenoylcysteine decarboxylase/phosphopantothenate--cysteine ligase CoaBC, partial [Thermomicrobiales bacterium]|nr:bifunctional phosphopantothenoylcysteine decarboxylase/phosphopantothenate--cysteine ligase CoaBC [Thermomicrobiales bacterium]